MNNYLFEMSIKRLQELTNTHQQQAMHALENGNILYFPIYAFQPNAEEQNLLSEQVLDGKHKNISYDYRQDRLAGLQSNAEVSLKNDMQLFMKRFALFAKALIDSTLPKYQQAIRWGRTSYRPAEIRGRKTSKRKDDTRLHVDSFPSTPVNGHRILRVFSNINPYGEARVWHVGESFAKVMQKFAPELPRYNLIQAHLFQLIKATKTLRSPYDHYMLQLHDKMKLNDHYQQTVIKQRIEFPAQSTWIVFTDQVSHAALSGQFLLEQTFYLPVSAMDNPELSPLKHWENHFAECEQAIIAN